MRNISCNWIGFAFNAAVTLVLTPFILHELGEARYGIWILTSSIIGYYGFMDLGFRGGVTQYLTRYIATRDYDRANGCLSSAVAAFLALGSVLMLLSLGAAYAAPYLFRIPAGLEGEAYWCIMIVGMSSSIQCAFFPYSAVFPAMQRFDLANLIGMGTRLLTASGIYFVLRSDFGLVGVSAVTCGASLLDYFIRWRVAYTLLPELRFSWRQAKMERLREIGSFGVWNFLISVNSYAYEHLPTILISTLMPIAAVGHYALATGLHRNVSSVLSPVGQVLYPAAVELHARGDRPALEQLYHDGSRLLIQVMISVVLIAMFWAEDFYRLWIGEKYLSGSDFHSVALLLRILLISTITGYVSNIAAQILSGAGYVRVVATALMCGSLINLTCCMILIRNFGLSGVAASTVLSSILVDFIAMPLLLQKYIGFNVRDFLLGACLRPAAVGALQAVLILMIRSTGRPEVWSHLILQGALAAVGMAAVVLIVGITTRERERFLLGPMQRLLGSMVRIP